MGYHICHQVLLSVVGAAMRMKTMASMVVAVVDDDDEDDDEGDHDDDDAVDELSLKDISLLSGAIS